MNKVVDRVEISNKTEETWRSAILTLLEQFPPYSRGASGAACDGTPLSEALAEVNKTCGNMLRKIEDLVSDRYEMKQQIVDLQSELVMSYDRGFADGQENHWNSLPEGIKNNLTRGY